MDPTDSVTDWLSSFRSGSDDAATKLWNRYVDVLLNSARSRLRASKNLSVDEEDLAICVFTSFFLGIRSGRIRGVENRQDVIALLQLMTKRRVLDQIRRDQAAKRGPREGVDSAAGILHQITGTAASVDEISASMTSPALAVEMHDEIAYLKRRLPSDDLRQVFAYRIAGLENRQIAKKMGKSLSSIDRKVRLVKNLLRSELTE